MAQHCILLMEFGRCDGQLHVLANDLGTLHLGRAQNSHPRHPRIRFVVLLQYVPDDAQVDLLRVCRMVVVVVASAAATSTRKRKRGPALNRVSRRNLYLALAGRSALTPCTVRGQAPGTLPALLANRRRPQCVPPPPCFAFPSTSLSRPTCTSYRTDRECFAWPECTDVPCLRTGGFSGDKQTGLL